MMIRVATTVTARVALAVAFDAKQRIKEFVPSFSKLSQHRHAGSLIHSPLSFFYLHSHLVGFIDPVIPSFAGLNPIFLGFPVPHPRPQPRHGRLNHG